jgi:hypothetical protein
MRALRRGPALALVLTLALAPLFASCATNAPPGFGDDAGPDGLAFRDGGADNELPACATGEYQAKQSPAAMLVLLQRSGSMAQNNKWVFAAQAIVSTLDQDAFDTMSLGLLAAPSSLVTGPACVFNFPVACGVPAFPQVDLVPAGATKSTGGAGVRRDIKNWLTMNAPDQSAGQGNPLYAAIQSGLGALQAYPLKGKKILFVVTDGGVSCTSLSSRQGYVDGNGCNDWENPNNIIGLVDAAQRDGQNPVYTFIVGVPGSDSYDPSGVNFPPYRMRAALSSIAKAGAPSYVPQGCNGNVPFAQSDPDPQLSCHFDMTQGYSVQKVADAIAGVRGKVLGCVFELPVPEAGLLDKGKVNVGYSVGGGASVELYRRKDAQNACAQDGCWDYTPDDRVELLGKACDDVRTAPDAKVRITVGCATIVK